MHSRAFVTRQPKTASLLGSAHAHFAKRATAFTSTMADMPCAPAEHKNALRENFTVSRSLESALSDLISVNKQSRCFFSTPG